MGYFEDKPDITPVLGLNVKAYRGFPARRVGKNVYVSREEGGSRRRGRINQTGGLANSPDPLISRLFGITVIPSSNSTNHSPRGEVEEIYSSRILCRDVGECTHRQSGVALVGQLEEVPKRPRPVVGNRDPNEAGGDL